MRALTTTILLVTSIFTFASRSVPINDTIMLDLKQMEGRWIEENKSSGKKNIYVFREDETFHRANDSGELLLFNIAGKYRLLNDTIRVVYQDLSRQPSTNTKVRTMYLQVISLSEDELNINKTEGSRTEFIRLRRQNTK